MKPFYAVLFLILLICTLGLDVERRKLQKEVDRLTKEIRPQTDANKKQLDDLEAKTEQLIEAQSIYFKHGWAKGYAAAQMANITHDYSIKTLDLTLERDMLTFKKLYAPK